MTFVLPCWCWLPFCWGKGQDLALTTEASMTQQLNYFSGNWRWTHQQAIINTYIAYHSEPLQLFRLRMKTKYLGTCWGILFLFIWTTSWFSPGQWRNIFVMLLPFCNDSGKPSNGSDCLKTSKLQRHLETKHQENNDGLVDPLSQNSSGSMSVVSKIHRCGWFERLTAFVQINYWQSQFWTPLWKKKNLTVWWSASYGCEIIKHVSRGVKSTTHHEAPLSEKLSPELNNIMINQCHWESELHENTHCQSLDLFSTMLENGCLSYNSVISTE